MELCYASKSLKRVQAVPCLKSLSLDLFTLTRLQRGANNLGTLFKRAVSFVLFCFPFILIEDHSFFYHAGSLLSYKSGVRSLQVGQLLPQQKQTHKPPFLQQELGTCIRCLTTMHWDCSRCPLMTLQALNKCDLAISVSNFACKIHTPKKGS